MGVSWKTLLIEMGTSNLGKLFTSKFFEKSYKKRHISKSTRIRAVIFRGKIRNSWEYTLNFQLHDWDLQTFWIFLNLNFLKCLKKFWNVSSFSRNVWKISKITLSLNLKKFGNSFMEAKIATPVDNLIASHYWIVNFKLREITQENRKKNLNHCKIR